MATELDFVEYVADQIAIECEITFRKMFGEYALYSKGKVVALICDNQLFVKPTDAGKEYIGEYTEGFAFPGAKPSLLIQDEIEDSQWLTELIVITERELPAPKPKRKKKK
ncbi:MAG: competence protein TfoX [bacterium]|nr:competence protein TfoX [bacterium]MCP4798450.1 competence protein TfoX [bacterium]